MEHFRTNRMAESRKVYLEHFREAMVLIESVLSQSDDLRSLSESSARLYLNPPLVEGLRYVTGPPISLDDLKTVVGGSGLSTRSLSTDEELVDRIVAVLRAGLDSRRFP